MGQYPVELIKYGGAAIVVAFALQAMFLALSSFGRIRAERRQHAVGLEVLRQRLEAARTVRQAKEELALSWNGLRKFSVAKKIFEGGDICSFYLVPHDKKPLPAFKPGQYLTFSLKIPGNDKSVIRCYSLSDAPCPEYYRVSIKKVPPPPDKPTVPPGLSSNFFHERVKESDILDCKAPSGGFFLDLAGSSPVVLIGGGVGITPVMSMLNAMIKGGQLKRETWFFLGVRNSNEHVFADHLKKLAAEHSKLHVQICYSNPLAADLPNTQYHHKERVSADLFKRVLPSNNYEYYICGPGPMMESIVKGLEAWGVPESKVHFEAFGPASIKKVAQATDPAPNTSTAAAAVHTKITFKNGKVVEYSGNNKTLLEVAEENGIQIPYACRAGNCGTCVTAIKSGEVKYNSEPGAMPDAGSCLVCVGFPKTDLVLDA